MEERIHRVMQPGYGLIDQSQNLVLLNLGRSAAPRIRAVARAVPSEMDFESAAPQWAAYRGTSSYLSCLLYVLVWSLLAMMLWYFDLVCHRCIPCLSRQQRVLLEACLGQAYYLLLYPYVG